MNRETSDHLEFRRRSSAEIVYRFRRVRDSHLHIWKRIDKALWIKWVDRLGWAVVDSAETVLSLPWAAPIVEQPDYPPTGEWISKKRDKSYVYELIYLNQDESEGGN